MTPEQIRAHIRMSVAAAPPLTADTIAKLRTAFANTAPEAPALVRRRPVKTAA